MLYLILCFDEEGEARQSSIFDAETPEDAKLRAKDILSIGVGYPYPRAAVYETVGELELLKLAEFSDSAKGWVEHQPQPNQLDDLVAE